MAKIDKDAVKKIIEGEYPNTPSDKYDAVNGLIDEYNNLERMSDRWSEDECVNFTTSGSSQYLGNLMRKQTAIEQQLRNMGVRLP